MKKKSVVPFLLLGEIIFFFGFYCVGSSGIIGLQQIRHENSEHEVQVEKLQQEVAALEEQLHCWHADNFYKEKIAREQLQMARAGDQIYYL